MVGIGHHQTAFEALDLSMGHPVASLVPYFDACRQKRNQVDYDFANAATDTEAEELVKKAEEFQRLVDDWVRKHHAQYES